MATGKAFAESRGNDNTEDRRSILDHSNVDGELRPALDVFFGAVQRIDQDEPVADMSRQPPGRHALFGHHGNIRHDAIETPAYDALRRHVGEGHDAAVGLGLKPGVGGPFSHDFPAGFERDLDQRVDRRRKGCCVAH